MVIPEETRLTAMQQIDYGNDLVKPEIDTGGDVCECLLRRQIGKRSVLNGSVIRISSLVVIFSDWLAKPIQVMSS